MSVTLPKLNRLTQALLFQKASGLLLSSILFLVFVAGTSSAQSNLAGWNFNNTFAPASASVVSGVTASSVTTGSGISQGNLLTIPNTYFSTLTGVTFFTSKGWTKNPDVDPNDYIQFTVTPNAGRQMRITSVSVLAANNQGTGPLDIVLRTSLDGYASNQFIKTGFSQTLLTLLNMPLTSPISTTGAVSFRIYGYRGGSSLGENTVYLQLDDLKANGTLVSTTPATLSGLDATCSTASTAQSFTLNATNATGALTLTMPTGFELAAKTGGTCPASGYASTTSVSPSSGTISQGICVRRVAGLTPASVSTNVQLTITGGNVATATVGLSGSTSAAPSVTIASASLSVCQGTSSTLTAIASGAGGYTYNWLPTPGSGQSTSIVTVSSTDTYVVNISDATGCTATTSASVFIKPLPNAGFSGLPAAYCFGASPLTLTPIIPGGAFAVSGLGNINGSSYSPPASGADGTAVVSYSVTVDACTSSSSQTVALGSTLPSVNNFIPIGTLGNGICSIKLQATGVGTNFVFTGPNGYKFSTVYRDAGIHDAIAIEITKPGTYVG